MMEVKQDEGKEPARSEAAKSKKSAGLDERLEEKRAKSSLLTSLKKEVSDTKKKELLDAEELSAYSKSQAQSQQQDVPATSEKQYTLKMLEKEIARKRDIVRGKHGKKSSQGKKIDKQSSSNKDEQ